MSDNKNWVKVGKDKETNIESLMAHFKGHAYDPHWHDTYLIGVTVQGLQQFKCRKKVHQSIPGGSFLLEPGELHDGLAPLEDGFTYQMLHLPQNWMNEQLSSLFHDIPDDFEMHFNDTLIADKWLGSAISSSFTAVHQQESRIVREANLDNMLTKLTTHTEWRKKQLITTHCSSLAEQTREYLHANLYHDIAINDLVEYTGIDRFRLTRAFQQKFGQAPHAYLIQLRLNQARTLLANGASPATVATDLCFSDQSHLGRWFRRMYQLTPATYRRSTNGLATKY